MDADYDKKARMFLEEDPDTQDARDQAAEAMERRRPETDGHYFDASKIWESCGAEVDPAHQRYLGLEEVTGFLAASGKMYLVSGDGMIDRLKLSADGDLTLIRDYADQKNRQAVLDPEGHNPQDITARRYLRDTIADAIDASETLTPDEIVEAGLRADKLSAMLTEGFAAAHYGSRENAPTVRMTAKHGDEKVAIVKRAEDNAPHAASNMSGPMAAITNAVKGAMTNISASVDRLKSKPAVMAAAGATTAVAVIGAGMMATTLADMGQPAEKSEPRAQVLYNSATGHVDFAVVDGNEISIMRDLGTRNSFETMRATTKNSYLTNIASNVAARVDGLDPDHVVMGLQDVMEVQAEWREKQGRPARVELTLLAADDAITVTHTGNQLLADPVSQADYLAEQAPVQMAGKGDLEDYTFDNSDDDLQDVLERKMRIALELVEMQWSHQSYIDKQTSDYPRGRYIELPSVELDLDRKYYDANKPETPDASPGLGR
ncbi:hypothetical protein [Salipiger mucosus]|uniref:Uncharacterized protein n=1 Tax=Salipiger mucosus DSM 16094 TaxID=1123237 RepID=S9QWB0_9RHOB|nr:hypothetical protein [Salipiger mucosus]EPX83887.1 hypothetical protein Salmuc_01662 [Salipiger mucosus DSM 16094]